jgi:aminopeptidase
MDYLKMEMGIASLKKRRESADEIKIVGNGIYLSFSIKGIPAILCRGHHNILDGEVFMAPIKNSANRTVQYNLPTIYQSISFENIGLEFKDSKIIAGDARNKTDALNKFLDADGGGRHVSEFAFGFNPHIRYQMCDILFDEKIARSFHFTLGHTYEEVDSSNRSQIY